MHPARPSATHSPLDSALGAFLRADPLPLFAGLLLGSMLAGAWLGWQTGAPASSPAERALSALEQREPGWAPGAGAVAGAALQPHAALPAAPARAADAATTPAPASLSARLSRWDQSTDPRDAFRAWQLAQGCADAREQAGAGTAGGSSTAGNASTPVEAACGDLSPGQLASRAAWLRRAALAGVHGAYAALAHGGPADLPDWRRRDPADPALATWTADLVAASWAGARTGDEASLSAISDRLQNGEEPGLGVDPAGAIRYWVAAITVHDLRDGGTPRDVRLFAARLGAGLDPATIAQAIEQGRQIAAAGRQAG